MSAASRLTIVLAALVVTGAFFFSSPSPRKVSTSKPDTSHQESGLNTALATAPQTGPNSELPRPVKKFPVDARTAQIEFFKFEFERPYLGYEGPNFTELKGEPSAGAEYLASAELFEADAVATAKFELVDEDGRVIQPLYFYKYDNSLQHARFFGSAKIPERPFRVAVSGTGVDGEQYRRVFERLFRPSRRPPAPPILPRKLAPREARKLAAKLRELEKQALVKTAERASKNPDGVIVMPRIEIFNMTHQSFVSERGNKLGMLLSYDMRFSMDGDYAHSLQMFPFYEDEDMRGAVEMRVVSEEINPKPEPPSYATPQIYVDLKTLVMDGSEAWYKGRVVYHFTIKLIPNFVGQNRNETKPCIDEEGFKSSSKSLQRWESVKQDPRPITYRVFMYPLAWGGETEAFDSPKVYYDGYLKEGAVKCLPVGI